MMVANQLALIRREIWEHRALYVVPAVTGLIIVLLEMTGYAAMGVFGEEIDFALLGAGHINEAQRGVFVAALMTGLAGIFVLAMWVLIVFYTLDALYAERKDKSILFWRSLPVTDAESVLSKLLTAVVVIPLITLAFIITTQLLVLIVTSVWIGFRGADAWYLLWKAAPFASTWAATLVGVLAVTLWLSPFVGWFLLVSAYTKRSPLLMASLPIIILPMLEKMLLNTGHLYNAIFKRTTDIPIISEFGWDGLSDKEVLHRMAEQGLSMLAMVDLGRFFSSPSLWGGLIICALFTTGAIYVRRYRDDV